jgi:Zn finger protein HypA/HybF involved in hydrogenase expression
MAAQTYKYSRRHCDRCGKEYLQLETDGTEACKLCGSTNTRQIEGTLISLSQNVTGDWPNGMGM